MYRRGQLFLIEVIIALTVLVILISALFSIQSFTPAVDQENLSDNGEASIEILVDTGLLFKYFDFANYSYFELESSTLDPLNNTKIEVKNTIDANLPEIANFKAFTQRYNTTLEVWQQIDTVNFEVPLPTGSDLTIVEYYTPGYNGVYIQFKFSIYMWYEVSG